MKALEQWQIDDIRKQKSAGKTDMQLAQQYNVHYRTIQNYCKDIKSPMQDELEKQGYDIKVISTTPGKTLNFKDVTQIVKGKEWIKIYKGDELIGLLEPQNVTAIVPI